MTIQCINDNTHEIRHAGRTYTIVHRSPFFGSMHDVFIDGGRPHQFLGIDAIGRKYPHLRDDLDLIGR